MPSNPLRTTVQGSVAGKQQRQKNRIFSPNLLLSFSNRRLLFNRPFQTIQSRTDMSKRMRLLSAIVDISIAAAPTRTHRARSFVLAETVREVNHAASKPAARDYPCLNAPQLR